MSNLPFILGLTGSIGMGKSTTAGIFADLGFPVWDADAAVHRLYSKGGLAVEGMRILYSKAVVNDEIDRSMLKKWIAEDSLAIGKIEQLVHPLVAKDRSDFIQFAKNQGARLVVIDTPLLFEIGGEAHVDAVLVVSVSKSLQKERVMAREGMTEAHFQNILSKQMPDAEKRALADYVIETTSPDSARLGVAEVLNKLEARITKHA